MPQIDFPHNHENEDNNQPDPRLSSSGSGSSTPFSKENDVPLSTPSENESGPDIDFEAVAHALKALLSTDSWNETLAILQHEQSLLLTEIAEQILSTLIREARQSTNPNQRQQANYLLLHLMLLHEARVQGIADAWDAFETMLRKAEQSQGRVPEDQGIALTREEAERAVHDAAFLAEKLGTAIEDPSIPAIQEDLCRRLAKDEQDKIVGLGDGSGGDLLSTWLNIRNPREERRFLEAHPELLDPSVDTALEAELVDLQARTAEIQSAKRGISEQMREAIQHLSDHLDLLRAVRAQGGTLEAIRIAYINAYGGFGLDMPLWLEEVMHQILALDRLRSPSQIAEKRALLLRRAIARARTEADTAQETLAELKILLWSALSNADGIDKHERQEEGIACLQEALAILAPYPHRRAHILTRMGTAYSERIAGERATNLEEAIACYTRALQVYTLEDFSRDYGCMNSL